jgi:hypothetical protein
MVILNSYSHTGGFIMSYEGDFVGQRYDTPIHIVEKDNKKYLQYELIGLGKEHITIEKKWVNKDRKMFVVVEGKYKDEETGWENEININLEVDWRIYDKVEYSIKDGILTIVLFEILNEEPDVCITDITWSKI